MNAIVLKDTDLRTAPMDTTLTGKGEADPNNSTRGENSPENLTRRGRELHADEVGNMINTERGGPYLMGSLCGYFLTRGNMKSCFLLTNKISRLWHNNGRQGYFCC